MKIPNVALVVLILASMQCTSAFNQSIGWQTLSKIAPLVIANGGSSGIYPDQTVAAYSDAANSTSTPLALLCDLQLTKDNLGICRTGWNLSASTNITSLGNLTTQSTYVINGVAETGVFAVDYTLAELAGVTAVQWVNSRPPDFDGYENLTTPEEVIKPIIPDSPLYFWLNVEYPTFYSTHPGRNSLASYLTTFLRTYSPAYLSATEVNILKALGPTATNSSTELVFKVLGLNATEESTNATYGEILQNMTDIATWANGILVPKDLIYTVDSTTEYLLPQTTAQSEFVQAAHKAGLEVHVYHFANDDYPSSFNYSYDSVREYLGYIGDTFTVDGFLTDFSTTAAEAINCYPNGYQQATSSSQDLKSVKQPTVIAHNGASGDYPGCTMSAYEAAISDGADYIDCTVQITSDGVPICREDPDLLISTNVLSNQILYTSYLTTYPELQSAQGVFSFDISYANVSTLKAIMYSPWAQYKVYRNTAYDGTEDIITLDDFLAFAKNNSGIGVYLDVQNAYYLRTQQDLDVVDAVVTSLLKANLTNASDKILVASEDSSALAALQHLIPSVKLVYNAKYSKEDPVTVTLPVLQEIKKFASIVALDRQFVDPIDDITNTFLATQTTVAAAAESLNMTVFYFFLSNEFVAYAADYRSDPILQINALIQTYKIDGFLTDFPATLYNFLHNNYCYQPLLGGRTLNYSAGNLPIYPVEAGDISLIPFDYGAYAMAPSPALAVEEPSISFPVPVGAPTALTGGPTTAAPSPNPSGATRLSIRLLSPFVLMIFILYLMK